jgi:hypothetical protein
VSGLGGVKMSVIAWLGVVSAIISIFAFLFAVWVWIKSDAKIREFEGVIQSAYDIAGNILWEMQTVQVEDPAMRLRNAERSLGIVSALRVMTGKYVKDAIGLSGTEVGALLERGVIWSNSMITQLETSARTREIWLATPDLEPDLSDHGTGAIVAANLKARKKYVYFCPCNIRDFQIEKKRLLANIGALKSQETSRVTVVPMRLEASGNRFQRGNTIIFFSEDPEWGTYNAFEEIVFTKVSARGIFWQEHTPAVAAEIHAALKEELGAWRASSSD